MLAFDFHITDNHERDSQCLNPLSTCRMLTNSWAWPFMATMWRFNIAARHQHLPNHRKLVTRTRSIASSCQSNPRFGFTIGWLNSSRDCRKHSGQATAERSQGHGLRANRSSARLTRSASRRSLPGGPATPARHISSSRYRRLSKYGWPDRNASRYASHWRRSSGVRSLSRSHLGSLRSALETK